MKKGKRLLSLLLALVLSVGMFSGLATTAFAASEQMTLYMYDLPRGGSNSAAWGHGALSLMGGWTSAGRDGYWSVFCKDSYSGQVIYCIEPGVHCATGNVNSAFGESFWDNYPSGMNPTISPTVIKAYIGRIMQYGWQGNGNVGWNVANSSDANEMAAEIATQLLVWETVVGERDSQFNHVWGSSQGKNNVIEMIRDDHPLRSLIFSYYSSIERAVQEHTMLPSFFTRSSASAGSYELKWNGTNYSVTLTDTNGVLGNYRFSSNTAGIQFSVSGNLLTISCDTAPSGAVTVTAEKIGGTRRGVVVWGDGRTGGGTQDFATYGATVTDPVTGFLSLEIMTGSMKLVKTSEDGKVGGISFTITGEGINATKTTNANGVIDITDLNPGVYAVTEQAVGIKILDKSAEVSRHMKDAFIRAKDTAENLSDDGQVSPSEYAEDKIKYAADDVAHDAGHAISSGTKKAVNRGKEAYRQQREMKKAERTAEPTGASSSPHSPSQPPTAAQTQTTVQRQNVARTHVQRNISNARKTGNQTIKTAQKTERTIKQTARSAEKATVKTAQGSVKTTQKTVKTAEQTSKAAIKTAQATAKATQKAAQVSAKAAQKAAQAARATAKAAVVTAKAVAKATVAAVKAIIAAVKELVAAIAAGGWVAVVAIVIICLIGMIVGSCFGIFFSSEDTGGQPMTEVVREINTDYETRLDETKASVAYDVLEMSGSRAVWKEVLAVYAVKTTTDPDNPQEVASMTDEKKELLKSIFWEMNEISSRTETKTETVIEESDDGHGNIVETEVTVTQVCLYITVSHKTADEMADAYGFNADQREQLVELLADENNQLWTAVLYGITGTDDQIVAVALSQIGNVGGQPYWSWYGFGSHVEWCACFVSWCANECGYIDAGVIPKYAGCVWGVEWFKERGQWLDNSAEPSPGMIIFFDWDNPGGSSGPQDGQSDHTGIVEKVEDGRVWTVEGNSGDSCREKSYPIGYYEILGYGAPAY